MEKRTHAGKSLETLLKQPDMLPFSDTVIAFLNHFSRSLLKHPEAKRHPELTALGFWLRPANLNRMREQALSREKGMHRALGVVLHITPANVDTMFIYSWVCSLLMGNRNIVRISSQPSEVKDCLLSLLRECMEQDVFSDIAATNLFISYPREDVLGSQLSLLADARVIWGGDDTINTIRQLPCKPRCRDIPFADRYSAALINGDVLEGSTLVNELAERLWRDSSPYDQMACSSPRLLLWLGSQAQQKPLIEELGKLARQNEPMIGRLNSHLVNSQLAQAKGLSAKPSILGAVGVIPLTHFSPDLFEDYSGQGLYYLLHIEQLADIAQILDSRCQTLSYWGLEHDTLLRFFSESSIMGIDRIVPVGKALDFSPWWDGYALFSQLSRVQVLE